MLASHAEGLQREHGLDRIVLHKEQDEFYPGARRERRDTRGTSRSHQKTFERRKILTAGRRYGAARLLFFVIS